MLARRYTQSWSLMKSEVMEHSKPNNESRSIYARRLFTLVIGIIVLILAIVAIIRLNIRGTLADEFANVALIVGLALGLILTITAAYQAVMTVKRKEPVTLFKALGVTGVLFLILVWLGLISFLLVDLTM